MLDAARDRILFRKDTDRNIDEVVRSVVRPEGEKREKPEPPWRVLIHNDDVTPIDYVAQLLLRVFQIGLARAVWITLKAHFSGTALVAVEPRDTAEEHMRQAHEIARSDGHAYLKFSAEPAEE